MYYGTLEPHLARQYLRFFTWRASRIRWRCCSMALSRNVIAAMANRLWGQSLVRESARLPAQSRFALRAFDQSGCRAESRNSVPDASRGALISPVVTMFPVEHAMESLFAVGRYASTRYTGSPLQ